MNEKISVVHQNPFSRFVAFDACRKLAPLLQFQVNLVTNGLALPDI